RRRWDDPDTIGLLTFRRLVYGDQSPWARLSGAASIDAIKRDDLIEFHHRYIHPNNAVLGLAGDFDAAAMKRMLEEAFRGWGMAKVTPPAVPKIKDDLKPGVYL